MDIVLRVPGGLEQIRDVEIELELRREDASPGKDDGQCLLVVD